MPSLFDPLQLRDLEVPNRAWMSPMCMYSAAPTGELVGQPTDFHLGHYSARAAGGTGLVVVEATAVAPEGRITPYDLGLWNDDQIPAFARLATAISEAGAVPAIQLAHAGRKASTDRPWLGGLPIDRSQGGWETVGASPVAFPGYPAPNELDAQAIADIVDDFGQAARRAREAGFEVVEVHGAHGYLLHSFLSPVSNQRTDTYGGSLENRARLVLDVVDAVRGQWPADRPVFMRISTTDWIEENDDDAREAWTLDQTVTVAGWAAEHGVDLVDCSSGGTDVVPVPHAVDYQTAYAAQVRDRADVAVGAVGRINEPAQAARLIEDGQADAVFLGRALLARPSWANLAAAELGVQPRYMVQYDYAL